MKTASASEIRVYEKVIRAFRKERRELNGSTLTGGTQRGKAGILVENLVRNVIECVIHELGCQDMLICKTGGKSPICLTNDGGQYDAKFDVHLVTRGDNSALLLAVEAKTYLDASMWTRAMTVSHFIKRNSPDTGCIVVALEDALGKVSDSVNEQSFLRHDPLYTLDGEFFLMLGTRDFGTNGPISSITHKKPVNRDRLLALIGYVTTVVKEWEMKNEK